MGLIAQRYHPAHGKAEARPARSTGHPSTARPGGAGGKNRRRRADLRWDKQAPLASIAHGSNPPLANPGFSPPALLNHRGFPLLARAKHFLLRSADLRLHNFALRAHEEADLPAELMCDDDRSRSAAVLGDTEEVTNFPRLAGPVKALQNFQSQLVPRGAGSSSLSASSAKHYGGIDKSRRHIAFRSATLAEQLLPVVCSDLASALAGLSHKDDIKISGRKLADII